jgi:Flp pilus assembly protein CpaB
MSAVAQVQRVSTGRGLLLVGLALALAGGGVTAYLNLHPGSPSAPPRTIGVVVAAVDIPQSKQIQSSDVEVVNYAEDQVPKTALHATDHALGQYAAVAISQGTPLTTGQVVLTLAAAKAPAKPYLDIPTGEVAIAIPSGGDLQNVKNAIQSGDHIDVIGYALPGEKPGCVAITFSNLVISLADTTSQPAQAGQAAPAPASGWVVFLPVKQALDLSYLFLNGQYKFALRSRHDFDQPEAPTSETCSTDFNQTYRVG